MFKKYKRKNMLEEVEVMTPEIVRWMRKFFNNQLGDAKVYNNLWSAEKAREAKKASPIAGKTTLSNVTVSEDML